jgi:alkanesulfonate monooxygenase SsuD/methylene tetrahydromethanopterin reductase-like flavin-dependent oxidoreductase (luciferase family)
MTSWGSDSFHTASPRSQPFQLLRQQPFGTTLGLAFVGTPRTIVDQMEEWLLTNASDGFNVMFPYLPAGLDDLVEHVVPELQRRGIFRREYEGTTLRENLGLLRPLNRFFEAGGTR